MNSILSNPEDFSSLLQRFFADCLLGQRNLSSKTVHAYRDAFRLFFAYSANHHKKAAGQFTLNDFNAEIVLQFLDYLESERMNCVRSRNARLMALHSFAKYVAQQFPPAINQVQRILSIPAKRFEKPLLGYLSREEIRAILCAPQTSCWSGRRDRVMLSVLYNTGARVSELTEITVADVELGKSPSLRLKGKGRKQRRVPIWKETASMIRDWIKVQCLQLNHPLIPSRYGKSMTRANVSERLTLATVAASVNCTQLKNRKVTPHMFRHSVAMHMLQSGVDITVIALWLGHESTSTTHGYIEADLAMKERVLNSMSPPKVGKTRYKVSDSLLKFLDTL
jgi:integrase/recombinase XerD